MSSLDEADILCWDLFYLMEALGLIRANPYYEFTAEEYDGFIYRVAKLRGAHSAST